MLVDQSEKGARNNDSTVVQTDDRSMIAAFQDSQPVSENEYDAMMEHLGRIAPGTEVHEAARILFPDDDQARIEYAERARAVDTPDIHNDQETGGVVRRPGAGGDQIDAVPAALAPFVAILAKCVIGALGSAGVNEVIARARKGQRASAEARVDSALGGCITAVVPPFLRPLAKKVRKPLAKAILWVILKLRPKR